MHPLIWILVVLAAVGFFVGIIIKEESRSAFPVAVPSPGSAGGEDQR